MPRRSGLSKRIRFEVFKRDRFTCQYCGGISPDVILHVDHIDPVSNGGSDDIVNLISACSDCNLGKGARPLSNVAALSKQHHQMAEMQDRREQLQLLADWHKELAELESETADLVSDHLHRLSGHQYTLNDKGRRTAVKLVGMFSLEEVLAAATESIDRYMSDETDQASFEKAFSMVGKFCTINRRAAGNPSIKQAYYIRGILRNTCHQINEEEALSLISELIEKRFDVDSITKHAKASTSWKQWTKDIAGALEGASVS